MKIVDMLIARAQRTPYVHLEGYMERFWLIPFKNRGSAGDAGCYSAHPLKNPFVWLAQQFGIAARVHHILRSDDDRAFHDHPWNFVTVILRGGYTEVRPVYDASGIYIGDSRRWYGPGSVLIRRAIDWHRLELPEGATTWTLFITGPYRQGWGFLPCPKGKVPYREYLGLNHD